MKFGVREICDVVLKAKAAQKIGNKVFYKNEPVLYFDSLKTSSMEGAATTVYAQGGRGNARLIAWEGERTVTFTMEDALISPAGFSILTGAGLIEAKNDRPVIMHTTEQTDKVKKVAATTSAVGYVEITLSNKPYVTGTTSVTNDGETTLVNTKEDFIYVMVLDESGEVKSEPYIASEVTADISNDPGTGSPNNAQTWKIKIYETDTGRSDDTTRKNDLSEFSDGCVVLVDYYVAHKKGAFQVDITPDKFGGNFYLEASTLFRDTNGVDMPAEFVIPNCKVQSNFTFTMASSGDPSTFTFTMDAFPDYTRWDRTKKVYAAIQVLELGETAANFERYGTNHDGYKITPAADGTFTQFDSSTTTAYDSNQKPYLEDNYTPRT